MNPTAGWKFAIEVHPAGWRFPAGKSWIAGWIRPEGDEAIADMRAWLDQQPCLGLHGLPPPGVEGKSGPPYAGFSFLLNPPRTAGQLRLEACDLSGRWTEFFRTAITVAADAPPPPTRAGLAGILPALVPALLRQATRHPERALADLAGEVLAEAFAEPLNAFPNPPLAGALEEPGLTGRVHHGQLSVTGWLAHRTARIVRVTAMVDPLREVVVPHGLARTDIAGSFPELAGRENSAFVGQVDLPAGLKHPVLLKLFAELDTGEKLLAFAQRFQPAAPAGAMASVPVVSGVQFTRAVWALRQAARRQGIPTAGSISAGRAAWAAYPGRPVAPPARARSVRRRDQPLRILVATHNLNFEGAPRLILELSAFLCRQPGISVRVVSPTEGPLRPLFEAAGMNVTVRDLAPALRSASAADFHARLGELSRALDWGTVDLVLANTMVSFWAVHLAQRAGKPAVLYVHESAPVPRFFGPLVPAALFPVIEEAFGLARRVVFTAEASRQVFAALDARRTFRVLPSWLDVAGIDRFVAAQERGALRAKHGFAAGAVLLLNLGTVCARKGQHVFLQAAALLEPELRTRYPDRKIEFVMVGAREDSFLHSLREKAAAAGLRDVRFVPETRENYDFHRLADLLVCTSFEESSPRVLLEAAAFGTPIVSTDVDGIPELLTGRDAWLLAPGDHYVLAAALRRALDALFAGDHHRAGRARATVARRFDERVSLPRHLALLREAAALPAGAPPP